MGILLISIGGTFMWFYANLFTFGTTFFEYFCFIMTKVECLILFVGIILVMYSFKKEK